MTTDIQKKPRLLYSTNPTKQRVLYFGASIARVTKSYYSGRFVNNKGGYKNDKKDENFVTSKTSKSS